jgi:hypothetical protein
MKTINFTNVPDLEVIAEAGIILTCNENMDYIISDEDYNRLETEFPAAFDDSFIVEQGISTMEELAESMHTVEDVELEKGGYGHDTLSWVLDGEYQDCTGEFYIDKAGMLHHTAIAPNGDEVEITAKYL